jgi:hypothetical protein
MGAAAATASAIRSASASTSSRGNAWFTSRGPLLLPGHDPSGEQHLARHGQPGDLRQQVGRRHSGVHAKRRERHRQLGVLRRTQVARERQREPGPIAAPLIAAIVTTSSSRIASQAR